MSTAKKTQSKEVALFGDKDGALPAHLQSNQALGNEEVGAEDVAIPRLSVLQALSPQVEDIDEAKPGMLHVSVTDDLLDSVFAMNLMYRREFTVFKKRNQGGGFFGSFDTKAEAASFVENLEGTPEHYDIVETAKHFLLLLDNEGRPTQPVVLYMQGTKLGVSKNWNTEIQLKGPNADRFASVWELGTVKQSNNQGSWYNLKIDFAGWAPEPTYNEAKRTYFQVAGRPEVGPETTEETAEAATS